MGKKTFDAKIKGHIVDMQRRSEESTFAPGDLEVLKAEVETFFLSNRTSAELSEFYLHLIRRYY